MKKLQGIFVPNIVPLKKGNINGNELKRIVEFLIKNNIHGIFPNGSTGEFVRFNLDERKEIVNIIAKQNRGRLKIIAGATSSHLEETLELCHYYKALECDAVSISPPYYFNLPSENILYYYEEILRKSKIDILLYNMPSCTNPISLEVAKKLAQHKRIVGIKDSSGDMVYFSNLMYEIKKIRKNFSFFIGPEELLLPALSIGADGGMMASAGIIPEIVLGIYSSYIKGDMTYAQKLQLTLLKFLQEIKKIQFPLGYKIAAAVRGFKSGESRQGLSNKEKIIEQGIKIKLRKMMNK